MYVSNKYLTNISVKNRIDIEIPVLVLPEPTVVHVDGGEMMSLNSGHQQAYCSSLR
jgi:hypothetical protein